MRRISLVLVAVVAAASLDALAQPLCSGASGECADELTVVSWGGSYMAAQKKAYGEPYLRDNPTVRITYDDSASESVGRLRAMLADGSMTWDLVDVLGNVAIGLCEEGIAQKIDPLQDLAPGADGAPATSDFGATLVSPCFIPQSVYSRAIGFRTDVASWRGRRPESICDIFDLANFPGKRSLESRPVGNLEWALLCDGVPKSQLYEVLSTDAGVERALAKLGRIKNSVMWWSSGLETPNRLADRSVVMGSTWNGRLFTLIEEQKKSVEILWDAQILHLDGWIIPKGLSDARLRRALHFVRYATDARRLADQVKYISYAPARRSSFPILPKHQAVGVNMMNRVPSHPDLQESAILYNYQWWARNGDRVQAIFMDWLKR
ncbi:MAG: extracellular solute-binding protein [Rhodobacteraceae bacterium]|nr:extracellular solute-binding protein [Paracoccaceae bacterium]